VRFQAEIIHAERNAEGNIISGSPHAMDLVTENWTFSRDLQSRDPNWILVATSTPA
jgi:predicted lipid-binding transport protein (Tim44 family)